MPLLRLLSVLLFLSLSVCQLALANSGGGNHEAAPAAATPNKTEHKFWQSWVPMLGFSATRIPGLVDQERVDPIEGRMLVVVFLASWCEPCQQLMPELIRLENRYRRLNADFVYVFAHDTRDDAEGFMKEFNLDRGYLANTEIHKVFHNPELPTIYVGDRHKWLAARYVKTTKKDLDELDGLLRLFTAF